MANLVANLLQFSRNGKDEFSSVDVVEEVNRTLELMDHQFAGVGSCSAIFVTNRFAFSPIVKNSARYS